MVTGIHSFQQITPIKPLSPPPLNNGHVTSEKNSMSSSNYDKQAVEALKSKVFANISTNKAKSSLEDIQKTIDNFHQVDQDYYRSGVPDTNDYKELAKFGIKTIIDLRSNDEKEIQELRTKAESVGMKYENISMDARIPPTEENISQFFNILNQKENLPVLVHCRYGKDRTGVMTALYRIHKYGWPFEKTYEEMKEKGYRSLIFPAQKKFLNDYAANLNKTLSDQKPENAVYKSE